MFSRQGVPVVILEVPVNFSISVPFMNLRISSHFGIWKGKYLSTYILIKIKYLSEKSNSTELVWVYMFLIWQSICSW